MVFTVEPAASWFFVNLAEKNLARVLSNLITNAVEAIQGPGKVEVILQLVSGDTTCDRTVYVLHYDSQHPEFSSLERQEFSAESRFLGRFPGPYKPLSAGDKPQVLSMTCSIATAN